MPKTVNEILRSTSVTNQIFLERYKNNAVKEFLKVINRLDANIRKRLLSQSDKTWTKNRLERQQKEIKKIRKELDKLLAEETTKQGKALTKTTMQIEQKTINAAIQPFINVSTTLPTTNTVWSSIISKPFENKLIKEHFKDWSATHTKIIVNGLQKAFIEGRTINQAVSEIFGTVSAKFKDGALQPSRSAIETVVRTSINHMSNTAKDIFYQENDDIVKGYQWVSTLDSRTSLICAGLDGKYDLYDGTVKQLNGQRPPAHFNCRSTTAPLIKSWKELGIDLKEAPETTRASMNGQVAATQTFNKWLKDQPAKIQKEVLGPSRYKLWKDGEVPLDKFVDNKNNVLTLEQIRSKFDIEED
jgi:SPP1 gp7 family putative phage head morphogenesis protein